MSPSSSALDALGWAAAFAGLAAANGLARGALSERLRRHGPRAQDACAALAALGCWLLSWAACRHSPLLPRRFACAGCALCLWAFYLFLSRTRLGRVLRACCDDAETAQLMGVEVDRAGALAVGLAGALAAADGAFGASCAPLAGTALGAAAAFTAGAAGGTSSLRGAALGGGAVGLALWAAAGFGAAESALPWVFAAAAAALWLFPAGLIGGGRAGRI